MMRITLQRFLEKYWKEVNECGEFEMENENSRNSFYDERYKEVLGQMDERTRKNIRTILDKATVHYVTDRGVITVPYNEVSMEMLVDDILEAEEISDELFKRIGRVLGRKANLNVYIWNAPVKE